MIFSMSRARKFTAWVGILALAGCTPAASTKPEGSPKAGSTAIATANPKKKTFHRVIEQPAVIEAFEETPLVARIPGYVEKVTADIGQVVKGPKYDAKGTLIEPGEVLAELSEPEMLREQDQKKAIVRQMQAEVAQARAALEAAEAQVLSAKAQVREAETSRTRAVASYEYWRGQHQRVADAADRGVIEKQVRDETLNKFKAAEAYREEIEAKVQSTQALVKEIEAKRDRAKADIEAAQARVLVAQADEARHAAFLEYRFLRAPFDGVVTRRNVHTGYFLQPGTGTGPNILFVVARTDRLRIVAEVPESDAPLIALGMSAKIQPTTLKDQFFDGKIVRTSFTLDAKSRTLRVELDSPNAEGKLRPGMYANLALSVQFENRWSIPAAAIFVHIDQPCCWIVNEQRKAVRTPVKLGVREGKDVELIQMQRADGTWSAVTGSEEIIVANLGAVSEGKEVPTR